MQREATRLPAVLLALATLLAAACASERVRVPPRVDLASHGTLGLIAFSSDASPELAELATRHFLAVIQAAQPGVPILELGDARRVLAALERDDLQTEDAAVGPSFGPEAIRAIGDRYGVDTVLVGELRTERARPSFSVDSLVKSLSASAGIEGTLSIRVLQTRSGATIFSNSAHGEESIARVNVAKGSMPKVGARDPADAESRLVRSLVQALSRDFEPRWEKP